MPSTSSAEELETRVRVFEYSKAAAVELETQPAAAFPASLHEAPGPTRAIPLDLSAELGDTPWPATSPNLLASFIRINESESLALTARATAQLFYCLRGSGTTVAKGSSENFAWSTGDLFVLPALSGEITLSAASGGPGDGSAALYLVHDEPLLRYLGVAPSERRQGAVLYKRERLLAEVEAIRHEPGAEHRNRMGILLSNDACGETKTLSHVLWALLNILPANTRQPPHRHNSVALDLCVAIAPGCEGQVYTAMGPELGEDGWVKNPTKMYWASGAVFTTPPGWWHSHHNTSSSPAWVLPTQDAGLFTRQRTLDIRFSHAAPTPAGSGGE
jgi:gentisate 1,2-dioxygenase